MIHLAESAKNKDASNNEIWK